MMMEHRYLRPAGRGSSMDEATLKREDAGVSRRQTNKQGAGWKIVGIQSITYFRCWGAGQHSQFHGQEVAIQVPSPNTGCAKRNYLVQHFWIFVLQYISSHYCEHHQVMFAGTSWYRTFWGFFLLSLYPFPPKLLWTINQTFPTLMIDDPGLVPIPRHRYITISRNFIHA